jgi:hypothetical protein
MWNETEKYHGTWWPSRDRETSFQGFLEFEDRCPRLTVASPLIGQDVFEFAHPHVVHGELDSGENVTLWDTGGHVLEFLGNHDSSMKHARRFTHAILGQHLENHEEARFRFSAYRLHGIGTWSAMDGLIPRGLSGENLPQYEPALLVGFDRDDSGVEYSAEVRIENPRRLETDERFPGGAIFGHTGENARVVFECTPPAPARVHDLLLFDLQALLTFSYQGGAPIQAQWLAPDALEEALSVLRKDSFTGRMPTGHVFRQQMILTTEGVEPVVLFPAWWKAVEELYPATQVISLYHHGSRGILESSVSSVIAVAEHLHGVIGPSKTRFPEGFLEGKRKPLGQALKQAFPGKANASFRDFMYQALKNDRPTLATRLEELAAAVTSERLALMAIDKDQWVSEVKSVRDLLAHTSSHVSRRGRNSSEVLDRVNAQTRAIVAILILQQMGMEPEVLDRGARALGAELKRFAADKA